MKVDLGYFTNREFTNSKDEPAFADEEIMAQSFANMLKALRNANGYTLKEVGIATDIPFQTIARYESGENIPSIIQAYKLAYFYEVSLHDMFFIGFTLCDKNAIFDKEALDILKEQYKN